MFRFRREFPGARVFSNGLSTSDGSVRAESCQLLQVYCALLANGVSRVEINRLIWASRRGMLELDLILLPFVENVYAGLSDEDKLSYQALMLSEDQDMYAWLMRREDPEDTRLQRIVDIVRDNTGLPRQL